ncbi:butyrophilin subfamily 1 member A1-like isoform X1 [Triplophysa dalaica]|uniref:butyrophilin subfamily 1 member A1-like isoform X1 n=1 Tax=Triplophysa dalaica TaxID=1582913 RepID=UPI0024DFBE94|nr:butyrophilin subfamily 1 member A1-like isoform X1 [Triplophysa dalaica]
MCIMIILNMSEGFSSRGQSLCVCRMLLLVVFSLILVEASDSKHSVKVLPGQIVGRVGLAVTLPCWISPQTDAGTLEVRWYRPERYDTPVLFYQKGKIQEVQEEGYRNRSSLSRRSALSNGLKDGDVSLRLDNLTLQDGGVFYCYVRGDWTDNQAVTLNISALGQTPVLSTQPVNDTHVNVSCRSSGWFPEPSVVWMSNRRLLSAGRVCHSRGADGTFSVHGWKAVSLSDASQVFCLLSLSSGEEREGAVDVQTIRCSPSGPWKALFITFVIFVLLGLFGFVLFKHRDRLTGKQTTKNENDELNNREMKAEITTPSTAHVEIIEQLRKHSVVITLDHESAHPDLRISKDLNKVRDSTNYQQRGDEFPYELCVCGAETFTSGRHYWEVGLVHNNVDPKHFWLIGVAIKGNYQLADKTGFTASKGFWWLCSDGPKGFYTNTEPPITLPLSPRPQCVGVLLDYDLGQLSFYDVTESKHLLTISTRFSGPVVPLFNPGVGDTNPLKIVDPPEPQESPEESTQPLLQNSQTRSEKHNV